MTYLRDTTRRTLKQGFIRRTNVIVDLLAFWTFASGVAMILDRKTIAKEIAWQPATWNGHPAFLIVYGVIFLVCCPLLMNIHTLKRQAARTGAVVSSALSVFLAITLVIEATSSNKGWLAAINYVLIASILGVVFYNMQAPDGSE